MLLDVPCTSGGLHVSKKVQKVWKIAYFKEENDFFCFISKRKQSALQFHDISLPITRGSRNHIRKKFSSGGKFTFDFLKIFGVIFTLLSKNWRKFFFCHPTLNIMWNDGLRHISAVSDKFSWIEIAISKILKIGHFQAKNLQSATKSTWVDKIQNQGVFLDPPGRGFENMTKKNFQPLDNWNTHSSFYWPDLLKT